MEQVELLVSYLLLLIYVRSIHTHTVSGVGGEALLLCMNILLPLLQHNKEKKNFFIVISVLQNSTKKKNIPSPPPTTTIMMMIVGNSNLKEISTYRVRRLLLL